MKAPRRSAWCALCRVQGGQFHGSTDRHRAAAQPKLAGLWSRRPRPIAFRSEPVDAQDFGFRDELECSDFMSLLRTAPADFEEVAA